MSSEEEKESENKDEVRSADDSAFSGLNLEHPKPISKSDGFTFMAMEASLRQTIAPEGGYVSRLSVNDRKSKKEEGKTNSSSFPLRWEEAKENDFVQEVDALYKQKQIANKLKTQHPQSFRWYVRMTPEADGIKFVGLEGDVNSVYPGLTAEMLANDAGTFRRYFSSQALREMSFFVARAMAGKDMSGEVVAWHSLPEYDFIAQVEIHKSITYYENYEEYGILKKKLIVVQSGETRIVTESMRNFAKIIRNIVADHREIVDHRFGNKIRLMHLLCQENRMQELETHFQRLRYEIDIRRKLFGNLPPIQPISPEAFFYSEFPSNFHVTIEAPPHTDLLFYTLDSSLSHEDKSKTLSQNGKIPLSPILLQVLILQDCASNALKHGTGSVHFQVLPKAFIVTNEIHKIKNTENSRQVGLGALRAVAHDLRLDIDFSKTDTHFIVTLHLNIEFIPQAPTPQHTVKNIATSQNHLAAKAQALQWVMIDDDELLCTKFKALAQKRFGIHVHTIYLPSDVANTVKILYALTRTLRDNVPKPLVIILDENLLEIDDDLNVVFISGAQLRDRLYAKARIRMLIKTNRIFFFSASAAPVHDKRISLALGKSGTVTEDIQKVVAFLDDNKLITNPHHQSQSAPRTPKAYTGFSEEEDDDNHDDDQRTKLDDD